MAELKDDQWLYLVQGKRNGTLSERQGILLQDALNADKVPSPYKELFLKGQDPQEATLSSASPSDVKAAQLQPPLPPEADSWGQTAVQVGLPLLAGLASHGNPVITGAAAGLGHFVSHAPLTPPDPTTEPMAAQEVQNVGGAAVRTALETGGAAAAGGLLSPAAAGTSILTKVGTEGARAALSGAGAAAGSLVAEPLAPSSDPLSHAANVGTTTAATQGGFAALGGVASKVAAPFAKTLTAEGKRAAQTLSDEGLTIPVGEVSNSNLLKSMAFVGGKSLGGGTAMRMRGTEAENALISSINDTIDAAKMPQTPYRLQAIRAGQLPPSASSLYKNLDTVIGQQLQATSKPVYLDTAQTAAQHVAIDLRGQTTAWQGVPGHSELLGVANKLAQLPGRVRAQDLGTINAELDTVLTIPNIPQAIRDRVGTLKNALSVDTESPRVINMETVAPQIKAYVDRAKEWLPQDMHAVADRLGSIPPRLSFDEAKELRSSLLALARASEPGGASRAPTVSGQRPEVGTGPRFANTVGAEARSLAGIVDNAMSAGARDLGGHTEFLWRNANEAYKVQLRGEWLQTMLEKTKDAVTGKYDGEAILSALQNVKRDETLPGLFAPGIIDNIKEVANALNAVQSAQSTGSGSRGLTKILHQTLPAGQVGAAGYGLATGHPGIGLTALLTPTALGMILQSPALSRWLSLGIALPPSSKVSLDALGRLTGVLRTEGLLGGS